MGRPVSNPNSGHDRLVYKIRILPEQLERAYRRVEHLELEARELGLADLIRPLTK